MKRDMDDEEHSSNTIVPPVGSHGDACSTNLKAGGLDEWQKVLFSGWDGHVIYKYVYFCINLRGQTFLCIFMYILYTWMVFHQLCFWELCCKNEDPNILANLVTYCKDVSNSCFSWRDVIWIITNIVLMWVVFIPSSGSFTNLLTGRIEFCMHPTWWFSGGFLL